MSSRKTDRMAWYKMDAGAFLGETRGLPLVHVGLYINLLNLYWTRGNELPPSEETLKRQLGVTTEGEAKALQEVLAEFFPDGRHHALDAQLVQVKEDSLQRSARATQQHARGKEQLPKQSAAPHAMDF
ncbi:DUF1376 domain-containing protein [Azonexus hydrophilus]|uniref:DUF1376 domain-containing protein n=1 Tax=Azonexus hydrophilus TaxID=418702 RepID=UPI003C71A08F